MADVIDKHVPSPTSSATPTVQVAAPSMPIESLLPPGANISGCPPWPAATLALPSDPGSLYNGMLAPFAAQTYRSLVLAQV